jgi:hypothetical protein
MSQEKHNRSLINQIEETFLFQTVRNHINVANKPYSTCHIFSNIDLNLTYGRVGFIDLIL